MVRRLLCVGLVGVVALFVAACGGGKSESEKAASVGGSGTAKPYAELRWAESTFPSPINWANNLWAQAAQVEDLVVQDLVEYEPDGKLKPGLASSIENPDPTTYIYNIRKGVRFSDGKPLTVADVVYSLRHDMSGPASEMQSFWTDVTSIEPRGSSAVVIKLKRPDAAWPYIVALGGQIVEKAQAEKVGEKAMGMPGHLLIGTGPWKFESFTPEVSVKLSRNPYWNGPRQPAERITVSLFKNESAMALAMRSGALDGATLYGSPRLFVNIPGTRPLHSSLAWTAVLGMGTTTPPFNDVHVRRAIAYALETKGIIKALYPTGDASEVTSIVPQTLFPSFDQSEVASMFAELPKYESNIAAAKRELAKSAYPHGFSTTVQALVIEPYLISAAQVIVADLAKIGITAKVQIVQVSEAADMYGSKVKLYLEENSGFYADPEGQMAVLLNPASIGPGGLDFASYKNPEVDKLLPEQLETTDTATRLGMVGKILKAVGSEVPYLPLYSRGSFETLSSKYVEPEFSTWTQFYTPWALNVKLAK